MRTRTSWGSVLYEMVLPLSVCTVLWLLFWPCSQAANRTTSRHSNSRPARRKFPRQDSSCSPLDAQTTPLADFRNCTIFLPFSKISYSHRIENTSENTQFASTSRRDPTNDAREQTLQQSDTQSSCKPASQPENPPVSDPPSGRAPPHPCRRSLYAGRSHGTDPAIDTSAALPAPACQLQASRRDRARPGQSSHMYACSGAPRESLLYR